MGPGWTPDLVDGAVGTPQLVVEELASWPGFEAIPRVYSVYIQAVGVTECCINDTDISLRLSRYEL